MAIVGSRFGWELQELLGLHETRRIVIETNYNDVVTVDVTYLLRDEEAKRLTGWLARKKFKLELLEEDEPVNLFDDHGIADTTKNGDESRTLVAE